MSKAFALYVHIFTTLHFRSFFIYHSKHVRKHKYDKCRHFFSPSLCFRSHAFLGVFLIGNTFMSRKVMYKLNSFVGNSYYFFAFQLPLMSVGPKSAIERMYMYRANAENFIGTLLPSENPIRQFLNRYLFMRLEEGGVNKLPIMSALNF